MELGPLDDIALLSASLVFRDQGSCSLGQSTSEESYHPVMDTGTDILIRSDNTFGNLQAISLWKSITNDIALCLQFPQGTYYDMQPLWIERLDLKYFSLQSDEGILSAVYNFDEISNEVWPTVQEPLANHPYLLESNSTNLHLIETCIPKTEGLCTGMTLVVGQNNYLTSPSYITAKNSLIYPDIQKFYASLVVLFLFVAVGLAVTIKQVVY